MNRDQTPSIAEPAQAPCRFRTAWWGTLLVVITIIAYLPVRQAGFVWDDYEYIVNNQHLQDVKGLREMWLEAKATPQYYPLVFTTFWVEYQLWGLDPAGFHVVNVLLQALAAVLLWRTLAGLKVPGAWLVAAIFALHPVQVESVAWISERKNVLSAVFYLLAALAWLRRAGITGEVPPGRQRWRDYAVAYLCFVAALGSKTVTCSLPASLLLVIWWKKGRLCRRDVVPLVPFFLTGIGMGLTTAWLEKTQVGANGAEWSLTLVERGLVAGRALCFYITHLVFPAHLTFSYPRWTINPGVWWQWLFPATVLGVLAALWLARARIGRGPLAAALFFVITLAPAIGFINVYPMRFSFVADHFQYLAGIGPIALAVAALKRGLDRLEPRKPGLQSALGGALLVVLGALTWKQCGMYVDDQTLWQETLRRNPQSWMAHVNLGNHLAEQGQLDDAIGHYRQALEINPNEADAHIGLGTALMQQGNRDDALAQYQAALQTNPEAEMAHVNLGIVLLQTSRTAEAIPHFQKALQLEPADAKAQKYLAWVLATSPLASLRDGPKAVELAREADTLTGGENPIVVHTLAAALAESGRFTEAVQAAQRAWHLAEAQAKPGLAAQIQYEVTLYQAGRPFHTPQ